MACWLRWRCCRAVPSFRGPVQSWPLCCAFHVDRTCSQQVATGEQQCHLSLRAELCHASLALCSISQPALSSSSKGLLQPDTSDGQ